jgi:uncharacterized protein (TIGR02466 family)|tara:strand:- start:45 stop:695 length:651 start_codon:yes stop_codon:yes gene_type:complete
MKNNETKPILYPLFSKVLYVKKTNINTDKILSLVNKENFKIAGSKDSVSNHAQVSINNNILNKKKYKFLKNIIMKEVNFYTQNVMKYKNNFQLTKSWLTKTEKNQVSDYHNHFNSFLSAVLYIKTDQYSGNIGFVNYSNNLFNLKVTEENIWNSRAYTFKPCNGLLIIFPSEMHHKVLRNESNSDRYSLAMNFFPVGEIGENDTDGYVNIVKIKGY